MKILRVIKQYKGEKEEFHCVIGNDADELLLRQDMETLKNNEEIEKYWIQECRHICNMKRILSNITLADFKKLVKNIDEIEE